MTTIQENGRTVVHSEGNKRYILHDGAVYKDTLVSLSSLAAHEEAIAAIHTDQALALPANDTKRRAYYWGLRANALRRSHQYRGWLGT